MTKSGGATIATTIPSGGYARLPVMPGDKEAILWEGHPNTGSNRLFSLAALALLFSLGVWLAIILIRYRLGGVPSPSLPVFLLLLMGVITLVSWPMWRRSLANRRILYMLTTRRALVFIGKSIVAEAILFGAEMEVRAESISFRATGLYLAEHLQQKGARQIIFEHIADVRKVARLAEKQGAYLV